MLQELRIENLGVIENVNLVFGEGLIALTGETGAGKTMIVEAISLLVGERADSTILRSGADEATVEGRFLDADEEVVITRVVPRDGRSRAYVNGRLATVAQLGEIGARLVDLHGQHAHQSLLGAAAQRAALDAFGGVDLSGLESARSSITEIDAALATMGGDERQRAREIDLLGFQVKEISGAGLSSASEDDDLLAEEELLAHADTLKASLFASLEVVSSDDGVVDLLGRAIAPVASREAFSDFVARLRAIQEEASDIASEMRSRAEEIEEDPERLAALRERLNMLSELKRKYGERLEDVIAFGEESRARLDELLGFEERAKRLASERERALERLRREQALILERRRACSQPLAEETELRLRELAMPHARVVIDVQGDAGEQVTFLLSANPGSHPLPLSKVASGGELARAMLALRLVLTSGPATLVFDEVDAGIGGEAAAAVGSALRDISSHHQVLVVTHLAQVAANARQHLQVHKSVVGQTTFAGVSAMEGKVRVGEIARMLSGSTDEEAARAHAEALLKAQGASKRTRR